MNVKHFHDRVTGTLSYVVIDEKTNTCAIIDSVLNFDPASGYITHESADEMITFVKDNRLMNEWILETHLHADHLTAAQYLKSKLGGKIGISSKIKSAIEYWNPIFHLDADGKQFDVLFEHTDRFKIGSLESEVLHTPGHTPTCVCYRIQDTLFIGDTLFRPSNGTSRTDFPGGSAEKLYHSIEFILSYPDNTKLYLCHDYPEEDQDPMVFTTVLDQKNKNKMIRSGTTLKEYVDKRHARDSMLPPPRLMLPSIQVNLLGGEIPFSETSGKSYLKIPIKHPSK